ncbi:hypothetical protein [Paenibacillus dakarensis]|uniref:hypothetical protein n=1 Tax=Paenibacillus dakarensis TaxID=1527293 RepID=UPI0006D55D32|nr:hypothetical protein [Paenibacillus dakarensis]
MKVYTGKGWLSVKEQFYVIILLFLYRLMWGYCLYRIVKSAVVPLLMRFPDPAPNELSKLLFFYEGEMALSQSSDIHLYAWLLLGMLLVRMTLTPLIHAGIFYNLHQEVKGERGLFFFQGMRKFWKPMTLFYMIETILIFTPAYLLLPKILPPLLEAIREPSALLKAAPYLAGWLIYAQLLRLLLLYLQFGKTADDSGMLPSLLVFLRHIGKAALVSIIIGGTAMLIFLLLSGLSLFWSGLTGIIIQQASYFVSSLFQLWGVTAQFQVWHTHTHTHSQQP